MSDVVFDLNFVSVNEIDDALVVGFADHQFETTRYVMFQRSLDRNDDDGVYVERDGQQFSAYGTVNSCTLTRHQINLSLDALLAEAVDMPSSFAIRFSCTDVVFEDLRAALPRIFSGTKCALTI
jgi:Immunity protein 10